VATQEDIHQVYGGVIPELACRRHIDLLYPLLERALREADTSIEEIDLISVARGPGLMGALLIGTHFAQGLSLSLYKPIVGVNHVEAHLYAACMGNQVPLPTIGVVISGGHTALLHAQEIGEYTLIGETQDDAIGEAFDKVASLLGLPYPGGPPIEALARHGNPFRYPWKGGGVKGDPFDFSFSGLKTAVLYLVKGQNATRHSPLLIQEEEKADIAASFQHVAFSSLVEKTVAAVESYQARSVIIGGGVASNMYLRTLLAERATCPLFFPPPSLCLDNAAMIAGLGYHHFLRHGPSSLPLEALTRIPFTPVST
jgi:N6-L-threonylcarbamoyladenine synthase